MRPANNSVMPHNKELLMTNVIQSPAPAPSTPPPATQTIDAPLHEVAFYDEQNERLAAESDPDSKALKALESMPAEDAAKEATKIQRRRRERAGVADPIVERKYAEPLKLDRDNEEATWEGTRTLRQAAKDLSFSRLMDRGQVLLNAGATSDQALGIINAELAQGKPSEMPLTKVRLVREDGTIVDELADHHGPIMGMDESIAFKNPKDAARFAGNYRDELARQQQALLDELQGRELREQQQVEQAAQEAKQAEEARAAEQKRAQQAKEVEAERAKVAQLQWEQQATDEEKKLVSIYKSWEDWAARTPEMTDFQKLENTRINDPARFNKILAEARRGKEIQARVAARARELFEVTQARATQYAAQYQAQAVAARQKYNDAEDAKFEEWLAKDSDLSAFSQGNARTALSRAAKEHLRGCGLNDVQIGEAFNFGSYRDVSGRWVPLDLRSEPAQRTLAQAGFQRLVKQNRIDRASKRAPIPPVQGPGVSRPRGAGDMERVRSLQQQLATAKGRKSLELAHEYTRAKRAAGML
jgi:hypothetical protein